jgi:carotenoid cleavage dioxygenase-like enzyme
VTLTDLPVTGEVPKSLCGRFFRNGSNPKSVTSPHWFMGNGMLHGVRLEKGRAVWYRNRYVRLAGFAGAPAAPADAQQPLRGFFTHPMESRVRARFNPCRAAPPLASASQQSSLACKPSRCGTQGRPGPSREAGARSAAP